jgi:O-antigen ligase
LAVRSRSIPAWLPVLVATAAVAAIAGAGLAKVGDADNQVKAVIVAVGMVAVVLGALRPVFALGFLLAMMPFEFAVTVAGTLTGTNELLLIAFAVALVPRIRLALVPGWARLAGGAMVLGGLLTLIVANNRTDALWGTARWAAVLVVLWSAFSLLGERRDAVRFAIDMFIVAAVVEAIFGVAQHVGITMLVGPMFDGGHIDGFFGYYTAFGGFLGVAAVLATGQVLDAMVARRTARAAAHGAALVVLLLVTALSLSRGAILVVGAGWATLIVLSARRGSVAVRALVLLAVFAGTVAVATPAKTRTQLTQRFSTRLGSQTEDKQRFVLQQTGRKALKTNPLGLGFANFPHYMALHTRSVFISQLFAHCHQTYFQVGLDLGWLGLAGFLLMALVPYVLYLRLPARAPNGTAAAAVLAALGGYLAQGVFDYNMYELSFVVMFAFLVWCAAMTLRTVPDAGRPRLA